MYTLTRHSMWLVEQFPLFRDGIEPVRVSEWAAQGVLRSGGVVLPDLDAAWDAAEAFMYPDGRSARPSPDGSFVTTPYCRLPLFVPRSASRLAAA